ncbi:MAG: hypothetical protein ACI91R_001530 [Vicingaceae bacterium]
MRGESEMIQPEITTELKEFPKIDAFAGLILKRKNISTHMQEQKMH